MFINNIDPVLFKLGFLEIRYYGLVYVFGFFLVFLSLLKHKKELNLSKEDVYDLVIYSFAGLLIGSRLFHFVFSEPFTLINNPLELFRIWNGGMSFYGGLIGLFSAGYIFCRKYKASFYKIGDIIVIPATIALALGRLANFTNSELVGTVTNAFWCVTFQDISGCRHPYQIYASISHLFLLTILFRAKKVKKIMEMKDGLLLWTFIGFYGLLRIITDFFREDPRLFGITIWQLISFIVLILSTGIIYKKYNIKKLFTGFIKSIF
ncbi:prolipoprotein diacylglyceryl transferase [Candidatus Woesearchaeota archaeon]|nr:prolipoprotein diacylglyceryl transferase [Candidatus Woesearchaeota archaeon]